MLRAAFILSLSLLVPLQSVLTVDVNLVNVFATVQDGEGRYVSGLGRDDFRVIEDGEERPIEIFEATSNLPSSLGVLIDNSGSSASILGSIRSGVEEFSASLDPEDETFVMSFAIETQVVHDLHEDVNELPGALRRLRSWGTSVFYDALWEGINKVTQGVHERKALIVLSDGNDNRSQKSYLEVVREAQRNTVLLYFVGIGPRILIDTYTMDGLASMSGGSVLMVSEDQSVSDALETIREELAYQYYLGYHASAEEGFHSIEVEVPGRDVTVRAREGYLVQ